MNKNVWREDKTVMLVVNATASRILLLADGKKSFSALLAESFPGSLDLGQLHPESLARANLAVELEDCFLQSAVFCVHLWERGLLKLAVAPGELGTMLVSPLLQRCIGSDGAIEIGTAIEKLAAQKGEAAALNAALNQFRSNLVTLFACDKLLIAFTGSIEDHSDQDLVPDTLWPQFRIGYVQPGLILTKPLAGADGAIRVEPATALAAITVTTTTTTFAGMIGDSVGRAESR